MDRKILASEIEKEIKTAAQTIVAKPKPQSIEEWHDAEKNLAQLRSSAGLNKDWKHFEVETMFEGFQAFKLETVVYLKSSRFEKSGIGALEKIKKEADEIKKEADQITSGLKKVYDGIKKEYPDITIA